MKPTKAELIERHEQLLKLDDVLTEHEKNEHFAMKTYGSDTPCGTVCCLMGHAARQPYFMAAGFLLTKDVYGPNYFVYQSENDFFGPHAFAEMFSAGLSSVWPEAMQRVRDRLERIKAMPEEQA